MTRELADPDDGASRRLEAGMAAAAVRERALTVLLRQVQTRRRVRRRSGGQAVQLDDEFITLPPEHARLRQ